MPVRDTVKEGEPDTVGLVEGEGEPRALGDVEREREGLPLPVP